MIYEAYRDDTKCILEIVYAGGATEEISKKVIEARERRDKYTELYFDLFDEASAIYDWRKILGNVPVPDTSGAIDWDGDENEPTPISVIPEFTS